MKSSICDEVPNMPDQVSALAVTGERFLPLNMSGDVELEHLHRYAVARDMASGKSVLDIASGEGYGSYLLAQVAETVIGVDISVEAIAHSKRMYKSSNLEFLLGSCAAIPVEDNSIDLVVSFETIEHHDQHEKMLVEIKRVLKPKGMMIMSCPDKLNYSDARGFKNEFHVKELYFAEFSSLLEKHFRNLQYQGQKIHYGSIIAAINEHPDQFQTYQGNTNAITKVHGISNPLYFIVCASDVELPCVSSSIFDGTQSFMQLLERTTAQLIQANQQLAHANHQLAYTSQRLDKILNSLFWRLAYPLRQLVKKITRS